MDKMLTQRVHEMFNGRNQTIGVFVGMVDHGVIRTGWSRVNLHKGDKFDMATGLAFALQNLVFSKDLPPMSNARKAQDFADQYEKFKDRCRRYFKQYNFDKPVDATDGLDLMQQFMKQALPLASALYDKGIMGVGIPVGINNLEDFAKMMKYVGKDGNIVVDNPINKPAHSPITGVENPINKPAEQPVEQPADSPIPDPTDECKNCKDRASCNFTGTLVL